MIMSESLNTSTVLGLLGLHCKVSKVPSFYCLHNSLFVVLIFFLTISMLVEMDVLIQETAFL